MKNSRLLGVFCALLLPLIDSPTTFTASILYNYSGNNFTTNDTSKSLCTSIGQTGCLSYISATFELSSVLSENQGLTAITADIWSISDGLTTITEQDTDFTLLFLNIGTSNGDIDQ